MSSRLIITAAAASLMLGCVRVDRDAAFHEVQADVKERTGFDVLWDQGSSADLQVRERIQSLLQQPLRSDTAVQISLLNNPTLQATYEELGIAQADLVEAGLLRNPIFDAELRFPLSGTGTGVEVGIAQQFLDILYLPLRKSIAAASVDLAKARITSAVLDHALQTRRVFIELQASAQLLELQTTALDATKASYEFAKRLREAGNITALDLANERAFHEQTKLETVQAEMELVQLRERLNILLGVWGAQTQWTLESNRLPDLPDEDPAVESVEQRAIASSLEVAASRHELEQAARVLGITRPFGTLLEDGELGVLAERESGDGEWAAGPTLSIPLPIFNQGQPAITRAQARLRQAQHRYAAAAIEVRAMARAIHHRAGISRQRVTYIREVVLPLHEETVEQAQFQYFAMQLGPLVLLQAKRDQIEAGRDYVRALRDYWIARSELDMLLAGHSLQTASERTSDDEAQTEPTILREEFER